MFIGILHYNILWQDLCHYGIKYSIHDCHFSKFFMNAKDFSSFHYKFFSFNNEKVQEITFMLIRMAYIKIPENVF